MEPWANPGRFNLQTAVRPDGDSYIFNGRKWFTTGALHLHAHFVIVMARGGGEDDENAHRRHSLLVTPLDAVGVTIVRNLPLLGHHSLEGRCEIVFKNVSLPVGNLQGEEGEAFGLIQARLGPRRIHRCMRSIG